LDKDQVQKGYDALKGGKRTESKRGGGGGVKCNGAFEWWGWRKGIHGGKKGIGKKD